MFTKADYLADEEDAGALRLLPGEQVRSNFTGLHIGSQVQFSGSLGFATGLIARLYQPIAYSAELGPRYSGTTAEHEYSVVGVGVPFVIRWFYGKGRTQLVLSEGLQWDLSYLKYRLYTVSDPEEERQLLIRHLSVLNTLSIRGEIGASFRAGKDSRINTGMALVIPVSRFGTARATEGSEALADGRQEVEAAILHDKAKAGVELNLTALIGF